jgi:PEP-CTERM motif-containing protein
MRELNLALASISMGLAVPASAGVVYDNGTPNGTSGNFATSWVQAEDFSFASGTSVQGAGVFIATFGAPWDGSFTYYLFADSGGSPGAVLASGSVSPTVAPTGYTSITPGDTSLFTFDFNSPFDAAGGTTYWLGIHAAGDFNSIDGPYWSNTAGNGTSTGHESQGGTFDNWSDNGTEHAFYLTGLVSGVPEPSTWAMIILGFGVAGMGLRRSRAKRDALAIA